MLLLKQVCHLFPGYKGTVDNKHNTTLQNTRVLPDGRRCNSTRVCYTHQR